MILILRLHGFPCCGRRHYEFPGRGYDAWGAGLGSEVREDAA